MPVHSMLAALAGFPKEVDAAALLQIWTLAERSGDEKTMCTIAQSEEALPTEVLDRLRLRKETGIRVAYLSRRDVPDEERARLLAGEKRSDVFAGLIGAAKGNDELADRLLIQFRVKPTKVLARQMLKDGFDHGDSKYECLKVLVADNRPPDWLRRDFTEIVRKNAGDPERAKELAGILPAWLLCQLRLEVLDVESQLLVIAKLAEFGGTDHDRWDYESRRLVVTVSRYLVTAAALPDLDDRVVSALDMLSSAPWLEEGERIAGALAGRTARNRTDDGSRPHRARTATGKALSSLVDIAVTGSGPANEELLQSLLENPEVYTHKDFERIVLLAQRATLVKAMQSCRSEELMVALWSVLDSNVPEACWLHLDDHRSTVDRLARSAIAEMVAKNQFQYSYLSRGLVTLLELGATDELVGDLPFTLFESHGNYNRYPSPVLTAVVPQVVRLQLANLGDNPQHWENFNNLAPDWSGSLLQLLQAARSL